MGIDFDRLTAGPATRLYGVRVLYERPGEAPFVLPDAVFDRQHVELGMAENGSSVSAMQTRLGVRFARFPAGIRPRQNDRVRVALLRNQPTHYDAPPAGAVVENFTVSDVQPDGGGCAMLMLAGRTLGADP